MTATLVSIFQTLLVLLAAHTLWNYRGKARARGHWTPVESREWLALAGDAAGIALYGYLFWMLQHDYRAPIQAVRQADSREIASLRYRRQTDGSSSSLGEHKGEIVLLNIWATWCPPCRREMPELDRIAVEFAEKGVTVLALSDEDPATVADYTRTRDFRLTMGTFSDAPEEIAGIGTRPVTILIGRDGSVRDMVVGARGYRFFRDWLKKGG